MFAKANVDGGRCPHPILNDVFVLTDKYDVAYGYDVFVLKDKR